MKDVLMQKEDLFSSCLAESPEISCGRSVPLALEEVGKVRRSAKLLGLAISLSALGLVVPQHRASATASPFLRTNLSHLPATLNASAKAIAAPDNSSPSLVTAASYPSTTPSEAQRDRPQLLSSTKPIALASDAKNPSAFASPLPSAIAVAPSQELDSSREHLREARKRLQEGLNELQSESDNSSSDGKDAQLQAEDVSQPLIAVETPSQPSLLGNLPSQITSNFSPDSTAERNIPVNTVAASTLENNDSAFDRPIPIPVPTPDSALSKATEPKLPPAQRSFEPSASTAAPSSSDRPSLSAFNQPIPIPVPTPASISALNSTTAPDTPAPFLPIPQAKETFPADSLYQVRPGDTLNSIARRHGITVEELIRANRISNPNIIEVSQGLVIPSKPTSPSFSPQSSTLSAVAHLPAPRLLDKGLEKAIPAIQSNSVAEVNTPISLPIDPSPTSKLKAELADLETTYGQPTLGESAPIVQPPDLNETSPALSERDRTINPEWQSDRPSTISHLPQLRPLSNKPTEQIIGAAPSNAQDYNSSLRLPVGYEVSPELPPLSSPDDYLPDAPLKFTGYIWPAKGVLTSGYGRRWGRMHRGIDIAAPIGTPVLAAASGEVVFAGWNSGGYGNLVKVRHGDGSLTLYAHNSRIFVRPGQQVNQGEQISAMGSTGFSTGPHLHFEVHPGGKAAVNPIAYLPSSRNSKN